MKKIFFALAMSVGVLVASCDSKTVRYEAQNVLNGELVRFSDQEGKTFPFDSGQVVTIEKNQGNSQWEIFTDAKLPNEGTSRKFAKVKILRVVGPVAKNNKPNLADGSTKEKSIFE